MLDRPEELAEYQKRIQHSNRVSRFYSQILFIYAELTFPVKPLSSHTNLYNSNRCNTGTQCNSHVLTDTESLIPVAFLSKMARYAVFKLGRLFASQHSPSRILDSFSLVKPEISSDQEDEVEVFDMHTSSGEFCSLY